KLIVAGQLQGGDSSLVLARYQTDGSLDDTFGTGGKVTLPQPTFPAALVVRPDGKLVVGGGSAFDDLNASALIRLHASGARDDSFGTGGIVRPSRDPFDYFPAGMILQRDGKLVAVGVLSGKTGATYGLARYDDNGSLDASFGANGIAFTPSGVGALSVS